MEYPVSASSRLITVVSSDYHQLAPINVKNGEPADHLQCVQLAARHREGLARPKTLGAQKSDQEPREGKQPLHDYLERREGGKNEHELAAKPECTKHGNSLGKVDPGSGPHCAQTAYLHKPEQPFQQRKTELGGKETAKPKFKFPIEPEQIHGIQEANL